MDRKMINAELLDQYLKGKLSESERRMLEEKASYDPLLQSEIKFQKDVYAALTAERKRILKSRLDQVPVGGSSWWTVQHTRWAAAVSSILLTASGMYYYLAPSQNEVVQPSVNIAERVEPLAPMRNTPMTAPSPEAVPQQAKVADEKQPPSSTAATMTATPAPDQQSPTAGEAQTPLPALPDIQRPDLSLSFSDDSKTIDYGDFTAPSRVTHGGDQPEHLAVDVETNVDKRYPFHYRYADGKLYLYGHFDEALYRVIALNRSTDKYLFLEYADQYYMLDERATEITPLEPIQDSTLIQQLKKISPRP